MSTFAVFAGRTAGETLERNNGIGRGFDFLRICLAMTVVWFHTFSVLGRTEEVETSSVMWFPVYAVLPMFFALSGFLIAGSSQRLRLPEFLVNRGLRIVPALAVEIIISALIIGPLFTILPLKQYFSDIQFFHYFTNIFGWIQYNLPGVFPPDAELRDCSTIADSILNLASAGNGSGIDCSAGPFRAEGIVNISIWTVPFEVGCYFFISLVIIFQLGRRPWLLGLMSAAILVVPAIVQLVAMMDVGGMGEMGGKTGHFLLDLIFTLHTRGRGLILFSCFLFGALAYFLRYHIPTSLTAVVLVLTCCVILAVIFNAQHNHIRNFFAAPVLTYLTVLLGLARIPNLPIFNRGDYSYGIYLYAFPFQQALVWLFPDAFTWFGHFLASLALSTLAAMGSWHFIEKPILATRKNFRFSRAQRAVAGSTVKA